MTTVIELGNHLCQVVSEDEPPLDSVRAVTDLIGDALGERASVLAIPVAALDEAFFQLSTGFAGEVLQKAANYGLKVAIIGDV